MSQSEDIRGTALDFHFRQNQHYCARPYSIDVLKFRARTWSLPLSTSLLLRGRPLPATVRAWSRPRQARALTEASYSRRSCATGASESMAWCIACCLAKGTNRAGHDEVTEGQDLGKIELIDKDAMPSSSSIILPKGTSGGDKDLLGLVEVEPPPPMVPSPPTSPLASAPEPKPPSPKPPNKPSPPASPLMRPLSWLSPRAAAPPSPDKAPVGSPTAKSVGKARSSGEDDDAQQQEDAEEEGAEPDRRSPPVGKGASSPSSPKAPPASDGLLLLLPPTGGASPPTPTGSTDRLADLARASSEEAGLSEPTSAPAVRAADDPVNAFVSALEVGVVVVKHDRKGRSKLRELYSSDGGQSFSWREPSSGKKSQAGGGGGDKAAHERSRSGGSSSVFKDSRVHYEFGDVLEVGGREDTACLAPRELTLACLLAAALSGPSRHHAGP